VEGAASLKRLVYVENVINEDKMNYIGCRIYIDEHFSTCSEFRTRKENLRGARRNLITTGRI
jgi:hypothetical protein